MAAPAPQPALTASNISNGGSGGIWLDLVVSGDSVEKTVDKAITRYSSLVAASSHNNNSSGSCCRGSA